MCRKTSSSINVLLTNWFHIDKISDEIKYIDKQAAFFFLFYLKGKKNRIGEEIKNVFKKNKQNLCFPIFSFMASHFSPL